MTFFLSDKHLTQKRGASLTTGIRASTDFLISMYSRSKTNSARPEIAEKCQLFITDGEYVYMNSVLSRTVSNTLVQDAKVCRTIIYITFAFLISFKRTLRGLTQMSSGVDQRRALRSSPSLHRIVPELQIVSSKSLSSTPLHIYDLNRKSRNVQ